MIPSHVVEYWLFGVLFAIVAALQIAWAEAVRRHPADRRLPIAAVVLNVGIVGVWVASRTTGLPIGNEPGVAEPVGIEDLLATVDELFVVLAAALLLARRTSRGIIPIAWALGLASVVAAIAAGGHS